IIGNPSLNHRYRKGFYSLFKTLQQNPFKKLKEYGFYQGTEHRTIKYLNNLIEQDHRPVKRRNKFYRSLRTAS
ncbi:DDE-type integrase/transposase/recombinase, partial [Enterococcus faecium]|nr:DDE-type integrase/transposase/recombinase [Enterococcus faecium]